MRSLGGDRVLRESVGRVLRTAQLEEVPQCTLDLRPALRPAFRLMPNVMQPADRGMTAPPTRWHSQDGRDNALALQVNNPGAFDALAEIDALGHRILTKTFEDVVASMERLVGIAMLRRAVTLFVGFRHLLEASSIEPAKLVARALFETTLAFRYLVHGGRRKVDLFTPSSRNMRETRAKYYYVAAERGKIYGRRGLLDGRGSRRKIPRKLRRQLEREIDKEATRLRRDFPSQWKTFGPLRFGIPGKKSFYFDTRNWYEFGFRSGSVKSVRALAVRLGWVREYELLYTSFSGIMHPRGISHDIKVMDAGAEVFHPYMAEAFGILGVFAGNWQLLILAAATKAYSPESLPDVQGIAAKVGPLLDAVNTSFPEGFI